MHTDVLVYSIIVYPIAGLNSDSGRFEVVFFATLLMCSASGLFCCRMLAALSPTEQSAINLFPVTIYFLMAFSGFGIYLPQMQNWLAVWAPMPPSFAGLSRLSSRSIDQYFIPSLLTFAYNCASSPSPPPPSFIRLDCIIGTDP